MSNQTPPEKQEPLGNRDGDTAGMVDDVFEDGPWKDVMARAGRTSRDQTAASPFGPNRTVTLPRVPRWRKLNRVIGLALMTAWTGFGVLALSQRDPGRFMLGFPIPAYMFGRFVSELLAWRRPRSSATHLLEKIFEGLGHGLLLIGNGIMLMAVALAVMILVENQPGTGTPMVAALLFGGIPCMAGTAILELLFLANALNRLRTLALRGRSEL